MDQQDKLQRFRRVNRKQEEPHRAEPNGVRPDVESLHPKFVTPNTAQEDPIDEGRPENIRGRSIESSSAISGSSREGSPSLNRAKTKLQELHDRLVTQDDGRALQTPPAEWSDRGKSLQPDSRVSPVPMLESRSILIGSTAPPLGKAQSASSLDQSNTHSKPVLQQEAQHPEVKRTQSDLSQASSCGLIVVASPSPHRIRHPEVRIAEPDPPGFIVAHPHAGSKSLYIDPYPSFTSQSIRKEGGYPEPPAPMPLPTPLAEENQPLAEENQLASTSSSVNHQVDGGLDKTWQLQQQLAAISAMASPPLSRRASAASLVPPKLPTPTAPAPPPLPVVVTSSIGTLTDPVEFAYDYNRFTEINRTMVHIKEDEGLARAALTQWALSEKAAVALEMAHGPIRACIQLTRRHKETIDRCVQAERTLRQERKAREESNEEREAERKKWMTLDVAELSARLESETEKRNKQLVAAELRRINEVEALQRSHQAQVEALQRQVDTLRRSGDLRDESISRAKSEQQQLQLDLTVAEAEAARLREESAARTDDRATTLTEYSDMKDEEGNSPFTPPPSILKPETSASSARSPSPKRSTWKYKPPPMEKRSLSAPRNPPPVTTRPCNRGVHNQQGIDGISEGDDTVSQAASSSVGFPSLDHPARRGELFVADSSSSSWTSKFFYLSKGTLYVGESMETKLKFVLHLTQVIRAEPFKGTHTTLKGHFKSTRKNHISHFFLVEYRLAGMKPGQSKVLEFGTEDKFERNIWVESFLYCKPQSSRASVATTVGTKSAQSVPLAVTGVQKRKDDAKKVSHSAFGSSSPPRDSRLFLKTEPEKRFA